jgi:hypothetical protein
MGVPVLGVQDSGFALGYRFTNVMGLLEYRMNNLQPNEYAKITGTPTAASAVYGGVQVGNTLSVTINQNSPIVYTVQPSDLLAPDPVLSAVQNIANLINQTVGSQWIASAQPAVTYSPTAVAPGPKTWQLAVIAAPTNQEAFTIAVSGTGGLIGYVVLQGALPNPQQTFNDDGMTAVGYLAICDYLESKTAISSDLMKYTQADVVTLRRDELGARDGLYMYWRRRLADVFGIPLYPMQPVANFGGANTGLEI